MITIVTDSSAYFKKSEAAELGVVLVPLQYTVNNSSFFLESYSDQNGDFENMLKSYGSKFSTTHPNIGAFLSCFSEELTKGSQVLCITMSSRLSGTFGSAYSAAKETGSEDIAVFDSQLTGGGLHLLIKEARKLADSGFSLSDIIKELPAVRDRIEVVFSVDDITPLRRSGRLGYVRYNVNTILNIKPILLCRDGVIVSDGVAHGTTDIIRKLLNKVTDEATDVIVNYIDRKRAAIHIHNIIKGQRPGIRVKLRKMGPVIGIHLGLHGVGVSLLNKNA
jgi:EDD domain protein, DegV family